MTGQVARDQPAQCEEVPLQEMPAAGGNASPRSQAAYRRISTSAPFSTAASARPPEQLVGYGLGKVVLRAVLTDLCRDLFEDDGGLAPLEYHGHRSRMGLTVLAEYALHCGSASVLRPCRHARRSSPNRKAPPPDECVHEGHRTSRAVLMAWLSSFTLEGSHIPIKRFRRSRGTVSMLSRFALQETGSPCRRPRETSVGSPRTVRVTRVTTIDPIEWRTASRVRITTGRFPTGEGSSAHQTSARLTQGHPSTLGRREARWPV